MKGITIKILPLLALVACSELTDLNKNKKDPADVPGEPLFTRGQKEVVTQVVQTNVNLNIFRLIMQYWTQTTYTDESNYNLVSRTIPEGHWQRLYQRGLKNLDEAYKVTESTDFVLEFAETAGAVKNNRLAMIDIMMVYGYATLVDTFGDIPYKEALNIKNFLPQYDDGLTIYKDLIARLNADLEKLDLAASSMPATADNIYQGDVGSWIKFANSLKLRLGIALADVQSEADLVKTTIESAVQAGVFSGRDDNAALNYLSNPPNTHPVYENLILSGRADYVAGKTIVDAMNALNDPRIGTYFTTDKEGKYVGGIIGASNAYGKFSHVGAEVTKADAEGLVLTYSEVEFLLAEAAARGYAVGGSAEDHYNAGIRASIKYWGGSDEDADNYLAQTAVAYATATGDWKQKIGTQSWIALYNRGYEAWNSWKRLDYPILVEPDQAITATPVRFTYPIAEQTLNGDNRAAAVEKIGGDAVTNKLFWDVN